MILFRRLRTLLVLTAMLAPWASHAEPPPMPEPRPVAIRMPSAPEQDNLDQPVPLLGAVGPSEARLLGRARFSATVQILGIAHYRDEWEGGLAPVDLAVGWGPMFARDALDNVTITQADRFYYWKVPGSEPWTAHTVAAHSANMHIIPGNPSVLAQVRGMRPGDRVRLHGLLVDAVRPDGFLWRTSLTRDDTGPGACEIFLVLHIERA